jgi:hypothetical protein
LDRIYRGSQVHPQLSSFNTRFGIRAAYDTNMTAPLFQSHIESLDVFTKDFEYPVNETTGFRGKMKIVKENEMESDDEGDPLADSWGFDWNGLEDIFNTSN